jgi:dephospho-CoA kinase
VVEVDGRRWHPDPAVDRERDNRLAELGWRVLRFTWADVVHRPEVVVAAVRAALAAGTQNIQAGAAVLPAAAWAHEAPKAGCCTFRSRCRGLQAGAGLQRRGPVGSSPSLASVLKIGLTGGIGSGKSSVSRLLAQRGAVVIDADRIARQVVAKGTPGLQQVVQQFGERVLEDGELDREALGRIVFADPEQLARLNAIVHPLVGAETARQTEAAGDAAVVVYDVPLLVENGLQALYDVVVVVAAQPATQVARLVEQRGMSEQAARARIAAQLPLADKLAVATYVIDNDGSREALAPQVAALWTAISSRTATTGFDSGVPG